MSERNNRSESEREHNRSEHCERNNRSRSSRDNSASIDQSKFGNLRVHGATANLSIKEREELRREMAKAGEKEIRIGRMGPEQRAKHLERIENRDVSEKIALGNGKVKEQQQEQGQ